MEVCTRWGATEAPALFETMKELVNRMLHTTKAKAIAETRLYVINEFLASLKEELDS